MPSHKGDFLKINIKHSLKLKSGSIKFKNLFKQLSIPFKIYADFEFNLKKIHSDNKNSNAPCTEKYQDHISCSFAYQAVCIDDKFSKPVVLYRDKNGVNKFIEAILKESNYCKKIIKKHFNNNLVMSVEDERRFQSSNKCFIEIGYLL